eukprot:1351094-Pyramimonas_sp.AAC.2
MAGVCEGDGEQRGGDERGREAGRGRHDAIHAGIFSLPSHDWSSMKAADAEVWRAYVSQLASAAFRQLVQLESSAVGSAGALKERLKVRHVTAN